MNTDNKNENVSEAKAKEETATITLASGFHRIRARATSKPSPSGNSRSRMKQIPLVDFAGAQPLRDGPGPRNDFQSRLHLQNLGKHFQEKRLILDQQTSQVGPSDWDGFE